MALDIFDLSTIEYNFPNRNYKEANVKFNWLPHYVLERMHGSVDNHELLKDILQKYNHPVTKIADRFRGALLGLAIGDAIGTTNEFKEAGTFQPIDDMVGGGPFSLRPGSWTDDTSMAYALGQSLLLRGGFDAKDQMDKYHAWYRYGSFSCTGKCFDIGNTVRSAIERYEQDGNPYAGSSDPNSAGNGSLMRLAPIVLFFFNEGVEKILYYAEKSSILTHAADEAIVACQYYSYLVYLALQGVEKEIILHDSGIPQPLQEKIETLKTLSSIKDGAYKGKNKSEIQTSGYVIHSLEAALWCFYNSGTYKEGVLLAANLGGDTDTIAAIYGQLAGAYYGEQAIPGKWVYQLDLHYIFFIQAYKMLEHAGLV